MNTEIAIALISLVASALAPIATVITHRSSKKDIRRAEMKQSILQMIMEDQFGWQAFKKLPQNYQNILHDFDIYKKNHGNSYLEKKVNEYSEWYESVQKELTKKK